MKNRFVLLLLTSVVAFSADTLWAAPQSPTPQNEVENPDIRLGLEKVTLFAETNKLDQAFALLAQLKNRYPDNPQILQAEADLNLRLGNRGAAFAALAKAVQLDPNNEDILERQQTAMFDQGPFASAGYEYRRTKADFEQISNITSQFAVMPSLTGGINVQNDHLHSRIPITMATGATQNFGGDRQQATLNLTKTFEQGNEAAAFIYANNDTPGAGALYNWWDYKGLTSIQANLRKPDWEYPEMVIQEGTRDNIHLMRKQIITSQFQVTLGGGFNNYNLQGDSNAAQSAAWDLNAAYTIPDVFSGVGGHKVTLGGYYTADAEYFTHKDDRTVNGVTFRPLPVASYEIHSLNVSAGQDLSSQVRLEGYGGYAFNRLGSDGPLFGGVLEYSPLEHLGLELRGSRTMLGGVLYNEREDQLSLNLKWRW